MTSAHTAAADRHRVLLIDDHEEFGVRAAALLTADPIGTNVIATVLAGVRAGRSQPEGSFWVLAEDVGGHPVGVALWTAGYPPFLAAMPAGVATLIAGALHRAGHDLATVRGDAVATAAFAERWCTLTGSDGRLVTAEGVHLLDRLVPPSGVPGARRPAGADDAALVADWYAAFEVEAHPAGGPVDEGAIRSRTENFVRRVATGQVLLWTDGGTPVSLAGWQVPDGPAASMIGRVGPVYTPPQHRRHGYAAGVTAAATRAVLDTGARGVMLYTDLANPTSNGVYARLGYRRVGDASGWAFVPPQPPA